MVLFETKPCFKGIKSVIRAFCFHSETGKCLLCRVRQYFSEKADCFTSRLSLCSQCPASYQPHPPSITRVVKGTCTAEREPEPNNYGYLLTGNPSSGCNRGTLLDGGTSWWPDLPLTGACEGRQLTCVKSWIWIRGASQML